MSLFSELEDLGELMATNITSKGVTASASDGLTTLAGKILQISGDTPTPTPTVLFEDDCSSSSGLSNYGSSECVRGSNATITMSYDSTENAYKLVGSGNYHAFIPIPDLDDEDEYTIEAEFKGQNTRFNVVGFFLDNRNDTTSYGLDYALDVYDKYFHSRLYRLSSDGSEESTTVSSLTGGTWYKIKYEVDGSTLTGTLYDSSNNQLATKTRTQDISNKRMGLFLFCEGGTSVSESYVRNIKAESLGSGSDCSQYTTQINNAITYINGSGS